MRSRPRPFRPVPSALLAALAGAALLAACSPPSPTAPTPPALGVTGISPSEARIGDVLQARGTFASTTAVRVCGVPLDAQTFPAPDGTRIAFGAGPGDARYESTRGTLAGDGDPEGPCTVDVELPDGTVVPGAEGTTVTLLAPPPSAPPTPTILAVSPGDASVTIRYRLPADADASRVEVRVDDTWRAPDGGTAPTASPADVRIDGLRNGVEVTVALRAVNAAGPGEPTPGRTVVPRTTPPAPTDLAVTVQDGALDVAFTQPGTGGAPITGYEVRLDDGDWTPTDPGTATPPLRIDGLDNDVTYALRLRAVNAAGPGAASAPVEGRPRAVITARPGRLAAGTAHTLALATAAGPSDDCCLYAWGSGVGGRLGIPDAVPTGTDVPTPVAATDGTTAVAAGAEHTLALRDGALVAWGAGIGALGLGDPGGPVTTPSPVDLPFTPRAVAAGHGFSVVLGADGRLYTAGTDDAGQLGNGDATSSTTDTFAAVGPTDFGASGTVATNHWADHPVAMAIDGRGRLWTWGDPAYALGRTDATSTSPVRLTNANTDGAAIDGVVFRDVDVGHRHAVAADAQGRLWTWGTPHADHATEVLGRSGPPAVPRPLTAANTGVAGLREVRFVAVAAGDGVTMAVDRFGDLWSWGAYGDRYSLGRIPTDDPAAFAVGPVRLDADVAGADVADATFVDVALGVDHGLALDADGGVWGWGFDQAGVGYLGTGGGFGATVGEDVPVRLTF